MSSEVQICFKTNLPDQYKVPETQVQLAASSTAKDLTSVLTQLFESDAPKRKFSFLIDNTFLTSTLQELLTRLNKSNETTVDVYYFFALEKPKPKHTSPQDEWVSVITPLHHFMNEKPKSYVCGLMNGDLKLYDQKHSELLKVSSMHEAVTCALYFKSDTLQCNMLISGSEAPGASLMFSQVNADRKSITVLGKAK